MAYHLGTGLTVGGTIVPSRVIDQIHDRSRLLGESAPMDVKRIAYDELGLHGYSRTIHERIGEDLMGRWKRQHLIVRIEKGRWKWKDHH